MNRGNINKLPKWAQEKIKNLDYLLKENEKYYKEQLQFTKDGITNVFISEGADKINLPNNSRIRFLLKDKFNKTCDEKFISVLHSKDENELKIYSSEMICVLPCNGNHIKIKLLNGIN